MLTFAQQRKLRPWLLRATVVFLLIAAVLSVIRTSAPGGNNPPSISQHSTGACSPNIVGSNNTNSCADRPRVNASPQTRRETGDPAAPWETIFTISTTRPIQTGDLRLTCSGPCIKAEIGRINQFEFMSGSNGPSPGDPNTVTFQLAPEPLSPKQAITVAVYSMNPVTVLSGSIGVYKITFHGAQ
jgi:hypothetical protein